MSGGEPAPDRLDPAGVRASDSRIREAYARRTGSSRYAPVNPGQLLFLQEQERLTVRALRRFGMMPLATQRALDVGCGAGYWLRALIMWGAQPNNLVGIDLLADRLRAAKGLCPPEVGWVHGSAAELGFRTASFDIVLQSTVFSSILEPDVKRQVANQMLRVLRPGGVILWYDFHMDNPRNPDVRGVSAGEIRALFPGCVVALRRATLAPPIARALAPHAWFLCSLLSELRLLCTHYFGVIRRAGDPPHP
jgi:SAM-dependent methyltransferase